jgi:hypothetical protein
MRKLPKTLGNNAGSAPTLHRWIEMELEEVFEGYYVNSSLVVRTNSLDAGWHNNVDPRLEHRLQITQRDSLAYRRQKKAEAAGALGYDLTPALSKSSFDGENDRVRRILPKVMERRK